MEELPSFLSPHGYRLAPGATVVVLAGGLYTGPGGGLYTGPSDNPYVSNWPPPHILIKELRKRNLNDIVEYLISMGFIDYM